MDCFSFVTTILWGCWGRLGGFGFTLPSPQDICQKRMQHWTEVIVVIDIRQMKQFKCVL